jgi:uncharacterized membrane protein
MIIMALDHSRDLFHKEAFTGEPLDFATTTPILYFTRWITHFCAPTFVFLSGLSAWLQSQRKTKKELSRFLITRGLWLVLMEITVMSLGISGDIHYGIFILQTIWSIGISMVILGLVIWLPFNIILALGLLIVFGHNLIDYAEKNINGAVPVWWSFLHRPAILTLWGDHLLGIFYPFLPWTGLMMLGYCCGKIFTAIEPVRRKKILLGMGIGLVLFFIALRALNRLWRSRPMDPAKEHAGYIFHFYECAEISAVTALYECHYWRGADLFGTGKKYHQQVRQDHYCIWKSSILLLYPSFLFFAYYQRHFLFSKGS